MRRVKSRILVVGSVAIVGLGAIVAGPIQASAATAVTSVFYSGVGCAGLPQAGAATRRLREQAGPCVPGVNGGTGYYNGRWASGNCDPSHAAYPETLGGQKVTQLVGYSLGRLGPLYLLRTSPSLAKNVNNIVLLDPGSSEITGNRCDTKFDSADNLKKWLAASSSNRLVIMAGPDTQANNTYDGINTIYLKSMPTAVQKSQVLVCAMGLKHSDVMATYGPMLIGKAPVTSCPDGSTRADQPTSPPGGGGGTVGTPPATPRSIRIEWSATHPSWIAMTLTGFPAGSYQYTCQFASGGPSTYTIAVSSASQTFDNGHTCFDGIGGDRVWVTIGQVTSNSIAVAGSGPAPATYRETVGGDANTWTNYVSAGGTQGPTIPALSTVDIACVVQGFRVADGNTNWYRVASSPWNNSFYVSADAFYNNGATSGSLRGTPFVDPAVPGC